MAEVLTARRLESVKAPTAGRVELVDASTRGLCFRVTATGERTWSLRIKVDGRDRRFTLGEYPATSLAEARRAAGRLRENVLGGADPIADRRRLADAERSVPPTVGEVFGKYAEYHLEKLADGKRRSAQLRTALDKFKASPVTQLKQSDLQAIIDAKARVAPVAANRLKAALVHFVNWSRKRGYILEPIAAEVEAPTKEQPRDRVLSLAEIGAIWRASHLEDPLWGSIVRLLMLTAQRRSDVSKMRWSEIRGHIWEVPASRTKNRRPHLVHLTAASLLEISNSGPELSSSGLLFTTTGATAVSGFGRLKVRLDRASGVTNWTLHDFRTAFATHCADAGVPEGVVDRVLNHAASASATSAVARVYQRSALLPQRAEALELWADMVMRSAV